MGGMNVCVSIIEGKGVDISCHSFISSDFFH
jgi:hypothetical protein